MIDIQVIEIRDLLKIVQVRPVPLSDPPALLIYGQDFRHIDELLINDVASPSVAVASNTQLVAQIPATEESAPIRSIVAVSTRLTRSDRSKITFRLSDSPRQVEGMERLIQTFLKMLLQSPGTDIFAPKIGGGVLRSVGKQIGRPSSSTLVSDVHLGVSRTRQQIMQLQAKESALALDERLLYARVLDAKFVATELALIAKIQLGNQAGKASTLGLGL